MHHARTSHVRVLVHTVARVRQVRFSPRKRRRGRHHASTDGTGSALTLCSPEMREKPRQCLIRGGTIVAESQDNNGKHHGHHLQHPPVSKQPAPILLVLSLLPWWPAMAFLSSSQGADGRHGWVSSWFSFFFPCRSEIGVGGGFFLVGTMVGQ